MGDARVIDCPAPDIGDNERAYGMRPCIASVLVTYGAALPEGGAHGFIGGWTFRGHCIFADTHLKNGPHCAYVGDERIGVKVEWP